MSDLDVAKALLDQQTEINQLRAERDALKAARCPSCDHFVYHHDEGCWYAVASGTEGRDLVCPCARSPKMQGHAATQQGGARARLDLAKAALLRDGYFEHQEVDDDIAPRIAERLNIAREAEAIERRIRAYIARLNAVRDPRISRHGVITVLTRALD